MQAAGAHCWCPHSSLDVSSPACPSLLLPSAGRSCLHMTLSCLCFLHPPYTPRSDYKRPTHALHACPTDPAASRLQPAAMSARTTGVWPRPHATHSALPHCTASSREHAASGTDLARSSPFPHLLWRGLGKHHTRAIISYPAAVAIQTPSIVHVSFVDAPISRSRPCWRLPRAAPPPHPHVPSRSRSAGTASRPESTWLQSAQSSTK